MIVEIRKSKPNNNTEDSKKWISIHDTGGIISLFGNEAYLRILDDRKHTLKDIKSSAKEKLRK